ncbi:hypothetical protein [Mangrovimonas futianensis]|uniref:hypothetical protein n=1 Tax=Mangrovimonas futianensis TaxID=2895523 RepID=UPI001E3699B8|nr:hypothetical protein [Mangrovimonas futianensis]MCF1422179.1 hypothetical protein [Mangrovimonas futianensis]
MKKIKKTWYKLVDRDKYLEIKQEIRQDKVRDKFSPSLMNELSRINNQIATKTSLNFVHSGHMGDLLYALPVIKELSKTKECHLYVKLDEQYNETYYKHPSGNTLISKRSYNMLEPLLQAQTYLKSVKPYQGESIDVDLDLFRALPISNQFHSFRWYFHVTGIHADMAEPYLEVTPHEQVKDKVVIVRTFRARNSFVDYGFLKNYNDLLFLGTKEEYEELHKSIPNLEFYDVKDFLEMAQIIKASRFYISNQTMAYAIAEGLKVPRLLEAFPDFPVMFPTTTNGRDFYFQDQFENYVKDMFDRY